MEQVKGIEPSCSAWEADILPLNYTCKLFQPLHYTTPHADLQGKFFGIFRFFISVCRPPAAEHFLHLIAGPSRIKEIHLLL